MDDVGGVFIRFEKIVCNVLVLKFQWLEEEGGLFGWVFSVVRMVLGIMFTRVEYR